jgi:hypothetical protein
MSGDSSADSNDTIYPVFGLYSPGGGDSDFGNVGNDPPRGDSAHPTSCFSFCLLGCLSHAGAHVNCPPTVKKAPSCRSFFRSFPI